MANPTYQTTLTLNETDNDVRTMLDGKGITVIDTWRRGAQELIREIDQEEKENGE